MYRLYDLIILKPLCSLYRTDLCNVINMLKVTFAHLGDIHLGYKQYNLSARQDDFTDAFERAIGLIISRKANFVLIAGDLFHTYAPQAGTIITTIKLLTRLKENDIPVYVIHGNHDATERKSIARGGNYINLLHKLGLLKYLYSHKNEYYPPIENFRIQILGIGYKHKIQIKEELEEIIKKIDPTADYRILMLHQAVEGQSIIPPELCELTVDQLKELKQIDYFALGHVHAYAKIANLSAYYPGSLERWDFSDATRKKGFIMKECSNRTPEFIEVPLNRSMKKYNYTACEKMSFEVVDDIIKEIQQYDEPGALLKIIIEGTLAKGEKKSALNISKIKSALQNVLYLKVENKIMSDASKRSTLTTNYITPSDAFMKYFKDQKKTNPT